MNAIEVAHEPPPLAGPVGNVTTPGAVIGPPDANVIAYGSDEPSESAMMIEHVAFVPPGMDELKPSVAAGPLPVTVEPETNAAQPVGVALYAIEPGAEASVIETDRVSVRFVIVVEFGAIVSGEMRKFVPPMLVTIE